MNRHSNAPFMFPSIEQSSCGTQEFQLPPECAKIRDVTVIPLDAITQGPDALVDYSENVGYDTQRIMMTLDNSVVLELRDVLNRPSQTGMGTYVVSARIVDGGNNSSWKKGETIIVIFSFQSKIRTAEREVLVNIIRLASKHKKDKWVLNHLPEVRHSQVIRPDNRDFCARLSKYLKTHSDELEDLSLTMLVTTEQLPVTALQNSEDAMGVFRDTFKCYRWLHAKGKVMHRDISIDNIIYHQQGEQIYGMLSDYSLVRHVKTKNGDLDKHSQRRTASLPFMAIDLLEIPPMLHYYRHDLESMFYCLSIVVIENVASPVRRWYKIDQISLLESKSLFMTAQLPPLTPEFGSLRRILELMRFLFFDGFVARQNAHRSALQIAPQGGNRQPTDLTENSEPGEDSNEELIEESRLGGDTEFDQETLGGHVNFDKFKAVITLAF